jgi:selT/selW/selH-like putative selenoprotein
LRLKEFLEHHYPHLIGNINGENYPPAPEKVMIAQMVGYLQTFGMIFCFFGETLAQMTGLPVSPGTLAYVKENRMQLFVCLFLMNGFAQNLVSTGAFEIEYNDKVIFSKLETNRLPSLNEIVEKLEEQGLKRIGAPAAA